MGLQTKYILANPENGFEQEFPEAYLRIQSVTTNNVEYEFFENVNDPDYPDIAQRVSWVNRIETTANVYVYGDEIARKNRAQVIHWFSFTFDYDLDSLNNIYQQAYAKLHTLFQDSKDI
jgi:hypothetical protein